jgi:hypothetical protein
MPYAPIDPNVYSAAYAVIAGFVVANRYPQNPNAAHYVPNAQVAEAFAEEMDIRWSNHTLPPVTQTDLTILSNACEEFFVDRYPQSVNPSDYRADCDAIIAIVIACQGIAAIVPITGTGPQGPQGNQGNQGAFGGPQGNQGFQGNPSTVQGPQGIQGNQGFQGVQGNQSAVQGPQGIQGTQGFQGMLGAGFQGSPGPQGNQGSAGGASNGTPRFTARVAVIVNVPNLAAFDTLDTDGSVVLVQNDIVLLVAQTNPIQNGPYVVGSVVSGVTTLTRPSWWANGAVFQMGTEIILVDGARYNESVWRSFSANKTFTVGTNDPELWPLMYSVTGTLTGGVMTVNGAVLSGDFTVLLFNRRNPNGASLTVYYDSVINFEGPEPAPPGGQTFLTAKKADGSTNTDDISLFTVTVCNTKKSFPG